MNQQAGTKGKLRAGFSKVVSCCKIRKKRELLLLFYNDQSYGNDKFQQIKKPA